ncbi:hypothetical protein A0H81_08846 [Grifola frondosa]|uniref:Uncharacterized protein n=1 Tax=Grifola frondosa TaxID=5627 RepID=A0A1C7M5S8_GRIFR|nr:hypothetical protein A0H81_08846 [Grifola frondosa]
MTLRFDIFGAVTGAMGLVGMIPLFYTLIVSQLPSHKLKVLDETLLETDNLWHSVVEEALFVESQFVQEVTGRLDL